jgi:hypothetical protein
MAVLADADRVELWATYMQEAGNLRELLPLTKSDLRAAVDALDDFLNANAAAINSAIPLPARAVLTVPQKARLLMFVIRQRYIKGA